VGANLQEQDCLKSKVVGGTMKKAYKKPNLKALGLLRAVTHGYTNCD
jgi:hypothetical protein